MGILGALFGGKKRVAYGVGLPAALCDVLFLHHNKTKQIVLEFCKLQGDEPAKDLDENIFHFLSNVVYSAIPRINGLRSVPEAGKRVADEFCRLSTIRLVESRGQSASDKACTAVNERGLEVIEHLREVASRHNPMDMAVNHAKLLVDPSAAYDFEVATKVSQLLTATAKSIQDDVLAGMEFSAEGK